MKSKSDPSSQIAKDITQWRHNQGMVSLTLDEMLKEAEGKEHITEQKVDGQSALVEYSGDEAKFASLHGMIMWDLPVLEDIKKHFQSNKITQAKMVGELAGYANGKIIPFNESESIIKNRNADKTKIHWFPYSIVELNGKKIPRGFEIYKKSVWPEITRIFDGATYVHPVEYTEGDIKAAYDDWVIKQKNEGIVVRLDNNRLYKIKPTFSYDLAILAFGDKKKGKNWPKKMISMALLAFMDEDKVFRTAGHVASGFKDAESRELFSWAQKNKVGEDDTYVWVKPEKIMEVMYERTTLKEMNSYKFVNGKYEKVENRMSGTAVKPRFIRWRTDKTVNPTDLRLTQVPGWTEKKKMAHKVASRFVRALIKNFFEQDPMTMDSNPLPEIEKTADKIYYDFLNSKEGKKTYKEVGEKFKDNIDNQIFAIIGPMSEKIRAITDNPNMHRQIYLSLLSKVEAGLT